MINIYIANLHAYNSGALVGAWFELPMDEEELEEEIESIINKFPGGEEVAIHDYEAPEGVIINEYDDPFRINYLAQRIEDDVNDEVIFEAIIEVIGSDLSKCIDIYEQGDYIFYKGEDLTDVAAILVEEGLYGEVPKELINYIDYEALGRDIAADGDVTETSHGVIVLYE